MKMHILRDEKGEVVAAYEQVRGGVVSVRAEPAGSQKLQVEEIDEDVLDKEGVLGVYRLPKTAERDRGD